MGANQSKSPGNQHRFSIFSAEGVQHHPHRTLRHHALDAAQIKVKRAKAIDSKLEYFSQKNHAKACLCWD
ncbi:hypothetical protein [Prochlorococcus marinus]|uniref:hypothetical protein n=1 Tax=Prochlorococcus marinus TaxID=1219 RepID=UPI0007B36B65|nr:hypothetical protein [Prochlorococcus marinus]